MAFDMSLEGWVSTHQEEQKGRKTVQPSNVASKCQETQNRNEQGIVSGLEGLGHWVLAGKKVGGYRLATCMDAHRQCNEIVLLCKV